MSLASAFAAVAPFLPKIKLAVEETIAIGDLVFTAHRLLKDGEASLDDKRILLGKLQHCVDIVYPGVQIIVPDSAPQPGISAPAAALADAKSV